MNILRINDIKNNSLGLFINNINNPLPPKEEERVQIQGKNGTTLIGTRWQDRILTINCYLKGTSLREKLREIGKFCHPSEEVILNFSEDEKVFYIGTFNKIENITYKTSTAVSFDIVFTCEPEIYKITNEATDLSTITTPTLLRNIPATDYIRSVNPIV